MNKNSIRKGISSYEKEIKKHKEKIEKEKQKAFPNLGLIDYWEKEVQTLENNKKKLLGGL